MRLRANRCLPVGTDVPNCLPGPGGTSVPDLETIRTKRRYGYIDRNRGRVKAELADDAPVVPVVWRAMVAQAMPCPAVPCGNPCLPRRQPLMPLRR